MKTLTEKLIAQFEGWRAIHLGILVKCGEQNIPHYETEHEYNQFIRLGQVLEYLESRLER